MDLSNSLFGNTACSADGQAVQNPMMKAIEQMMIGGALNQVDSQFQADLGDHFEDAWEAAELMPPPDYGDFEGMWKESLDQAPEHFEEAWQSSEHTRDIAGSILNTLNRQADPRFKNSEFYQFVQKLHTGQARFEENQIVEDFGEIWANSKPEAVVNEPTFEQIWSERKEDELEDVMGNNPEVQQAWEAAKEEAERVWKELNPAEAAFESAWEEGKGPENEEMEKVWQEVNEEEEENYEQIWNELGNEEYQNMMANWAKAWEGPAKDVYNFEEMNPYLDASNPFEIALMKIKEGNTPEAILCLEAEVQINKENSEAWLWLGKLQAQNDDDTKAIQAMQRGLEVDPYNLELLMLLGISSINESEQDEALNYLRTWFANHPDYSGIIIPESITKDEFKEVFHSAIDIHPTDPDLYLAHGVLHFLDGDYVDAEDSFRKALQIREEDPGLWNKLGASLAKQNRQEDALHCYYKALELKPDYVRTWTNIGIAYSNLRDYATSARFYLCALSLNPELSHVYNYLTTAFVCMERSDLLMKLDARDPMAFADEFHIIRRGDLPRTNEWVEEFANLTT